MPLVNPEGKTPIPSFGGWRGPLSGFPGEASHRILPVFSSNPMGNLSVASERGKERQSPGYGACMVSLGSPTSIPWRGVKRVMERQILRRSAVFACVVTTLTVSACEDFGDDPLATSVAPETHGAVLFAEGLPTLSELAELHGVGPAVKPELDLWWDSWNLAPAEGGEVRAALYQPLSHALFPFLLDDGVSELLSQNERSLLAAQGAGVLPIADAVDAAMEKAWDRHQRAVLSLGKGEGETALSFALQSADAVREVSPEQVARALLTKASDAMRRKLGVVTYSEEELTRIRRLTLGAEEALEAGDYPRAIRRAYYACQLLGAGPG